MNAVGKARAVTDPELRSILPSIPAGGLTTLLVVAGATPYLASTWSRPHRGELAILFAVATLIAIAVMLAPRERLLGPALREPFFLAWTIVDTSLIAAAAALDGGVGSPFTALLFLTQAFAAIFYPFRLVVVAALVNLAALAAIALLGAEAGAGQSWFLACALAGTAFLCGWQSRNVSAERRELARVSRSDPLTGCLNRRGFEQRLDEEVERSRRSGASFALVVLDLDDFKRVNDEHGHAAGDEVLCATVAAMARVVRGMDSIGRLGGDEFALLFPDADCDLLGEIERRVELAVAARVPCSLGAACFPAHADDAEALLVRADSEMYRRKREVVRLVEGLQGRGSSRTTAPGGLSSRSPL